MREVRLRPKARRDLAGIFAYTKSRWSLQQADRYVAAIHKDIQNLRAKPELGRAVRGVQAPIFMRASGSHVVFYLVDDERIDVVRILHESMDFGAHLANET